MVDCFKVGIITQTHGIKGELKVFPTTDDAKRFKNLKETILLCDNKEYALNVEQVKFFKEYVIVKFKEYNDINDVLKFKGGELYVERKNAVKLNKDEYFIADLIDMEAVSDDGLYKGKVVDVMTGASNDVYVILLDDDRELLLPAIKECILKVDIDKRTILFHLMDGLL